MNDDLRVKNVVNGDKKDEKTAVKIKENSGDLPEKRRGANIAFREMWENAFIRKKPLEHYEESGNVKQRPPSPFVYLRVTFMFVMLFIVLLSVFYMFEGYEMFPVILTIMVLFVPVVSGIFFYETDTSGRVSFYRVCFIFFLSCIAALAVKFVSFRFIYEINGEAISYFGAAAIGLMVSVFMVTLCILFVKRLKIKDMLSGVLIGAITGVGFAIVNGANLCFKAAFVETQYAPTIEVIIYNESLLSSFNNMLGVFLFECLLHSLTYVLTCAALGGTLVDVFNKGLKERSLILTLLAMSVGAWLIETLWVIPFASVPDLFVYILRALMTVSSFLLAVKAVRTGLSQNVYE
ncbi:MAG: hypothetical protein J6Z34_02860 [Clostridia bacterium]|nr:hypothetical protein [Clostridia bacterium]